MSEIVYKYKIPLTIITIISTLLILDYFVSVTFLASFKNQMVIWVTIIYNFAVFVGAFQILRFHSRNIIRSSEPLTRFYGLATVVSFFAFLAVGWGIGLNSQFYTDLFMNTLIPVGATVWGLNFIFSAMGVYRAMRLGSLEALALFLAGTVYFLKEMPIVAVVFPSIVGIGEWVMTYAGGSSYRVGILTAAMASLIIAIRTILQKEESAIG